MKYAMWTIGRNREKEHARKFLGPSADSSLIEAVIDAVHDLIDGRSVTDDTLSAFRRGVIDGGGGTWESTGSWLRKTIPEHPSLSDLWLEFATHRSAGIRFRAAAFVSAMPEDIAKTALPRLLADKSAKVRSKAAGDQHDTKWDWVASLLVERRGIEDDDCVNESIDFALAAIRSRLSDHERGKFKDEQAAASDGDKPSK